MKKIILRVLNEDGLKCIKVSGFDDAHGAMSWLTEKGFEHDDGRISFWFKRDVRAIGTSVEGNICDRVPPLSVTASMSTPSHALRAWLSFYYQRGSGHILNELGFCGYCTAKIYCATRI
jgi:hypothetical protein